MIIMHIYLAQIFIMEHCHFARISFRAHNVGLKQNDMLPLLDKNYQVEQVNCYYWTSYY